MTAARLILLLLLILVAVVIVVVVLRRGSAQRDAHRVEAANLRSEAETLAASVAGQSAFADQAAERAEVARLEAEERAREAARLEAEAAQHRATLEATQRDYEATMRRADDIDPDVKESQYPAVTESEGGHPGAAATQPDAGTDERGDVTDGAHRDDSDHGEHVDHADDGEGDVPMTRAERREAREAGEGDGGAGWAAPAAASSAPAAGAVGGAAAGASAWAGRGDDDRHDDDDRHGHSDHHSDEDSQRIASAADFRDDVPAQQTEVYATSERGSDPDMSDNSSTETTQHPGNDDGLDAGGAAAAASAGGGAYAATRAMHDDDGGNGSGASTATTDDTTTDRIADGTNGSTADGSAAGTNGDYTDPAAATSGDAADVTDHDHESGDTDGADGTDARERAGEDTSHHAQTEGAPAEMTIVGEPEAYATTEPVMASEQTAPVSPEQADAGLAPREGHDADTERQEGSTDGRNDDVSTGGHAPAEAGAAVAETDPTDRSAADVAEESTQERYDPTPTRDWAADEGELLEQNSDRGDRLEDERTDLAHEAGDATPATAADHGDMGTASGNGGTASDQGAGATASAGRRISAFEEIRDGGFGVGSAALLDDGAQPLDHPVKGCRDMTFRAPGDNGYDSAEPDVWFYDAGAAERSGFRRSDG